ncbi:MAG: hypothetical protein N2Z23_03720 [Pyrinomonadaceae bacterium]|nr:hypothetical protein [Pyrinomonadaceae bacterium]MCX7639535.1 hypothetical protein [Pyrinomonadaceae bacterium]MDW8304414.1 hypothetical protein [Acidobacteriota bacterium]
MRKIAFTLLCFVCFQTACLTPKKTPPLELIFAKAKEKRGKLPLIIVPGVLGTELINKQTGEKVWFSRSISKNDTLALPINPDLSKNTDNLIASDILKKTKVFRLLPEIGIYEELINAIEKYGGYKIGSWENPSEHDVSDTFYIFAYDWRQDNVQNARLLIRKIEFLKQKLGKENLKFNVLAHSMGGLIVRYAVMYGDKDLPDRKELLNPDWSGAKHFNKVFLFGTPNKGSMSAFIGLLEGYSVETPVGSIRFPNLSSDVLFTFPSTFQLMPEPDSVRFYDENLQPIKVDLYNPETWKTYGWSALYKTKRRAEKIEFTETAKDYLETVLGRAKLFHEALNVETYPPLDLTFFVFGSDCAQTLSGAILRQDARNGLWQIIYKPKSYKTKEGKQIKRSNIKNLIFSPGDGRVTRDSLFFALNARKLAINFNLFCEEHGELVNNKIVQNNFLTSLILEIL